MQASAVLSQPKPCKSIQEIIDDPKLSDGDVLQTLDAYKKFKDRNYVVLLSHAIAKQNYRVIRCVLSQLSPDDFLALEPLFKLVIEDFDGKKQVNVFDLFKPYLFGLKRQNELYANSYENRVYASDDEYDYYKWSPPYYVESIDTYYERSARSRYFLADKIINQELYLKLQEMLFRILTLAASLGCEKIVRDFVGYFLERGDVEIGKGYLGCEFLIWQDSEFKEEDSAGWCGGRSKQKKYSYNVDFDEKFKIAIAAANARQQFSVANYLKEMLGHQFLVGKEQTCANKLYFYAQNNWGDKMKAYLSVNEKTVTIPEAQAALVIAKKFKAVDVQAHLVGFIEVQQSLLCAQQREEAAIAARFTYMGALHRPQPLQPQAGAAAAAAAGAGAGAVRAFSLDAKRR